MSAQERRQPVLESPRDEPSDVSTGITPPRPDRVRILAILSALGGRYGWHWWVPLFVWGTYATVSRLQANADPSAFPFQTGAYESFTVVSLLAVLVIWLWGSRLAVSFGLRRGHVFLITSFTTVGMLVGTPLLAEVANHIEHEIVGRGPIRVMATSVPKAFEEGGEPVPSLLLTDLLRWTLSDLVYLLPAFVALIVVVCWGMRWSWRGVLTGLLLVPVAFLGHLQLWWMFATSSRGPRQALLGDTLAMGITVGALLVLAWLAFRRAPV